MSTRTLRDRCLVAASGAMALGLLFAAAAPVQAQSTQLDPRWKAWVGCWEPVGNEPLAADRSTTAGEVCVMPAAGTSAIDLASVDNGKILSREHIDANGEHQPLNQDGCTGWQSAVWSAEGQRVYLHSEQSCSGLKRTSNGVLAISPEGELLDIRGVSAGAGSGVRILRYREASLSQTLTSVAALLEDQKLAVNTARTAAEAPVTTSDVIEASKHLDAPVLQAWLVARHEGFNVDGAELVKLADAGVPGSVIDAMVALSYPKVFAISPSTPAGEFRPNATQRVASRYGDNETPTSVVMLDPYGYSPFGWGLFSPYGYSAFGYPGFGYSGFGYPGFGYGWYPGYAPVTIVRTNPPAPPSHGKMVKGRGYVPGAGSSNTGRTATPTSRVTSPRTGSSGYTGGVSASRTGSSAGSGATTRTAHKRP